MISITNNLIKSAAPLRRSVSPLRLANGMLPITPAPAFWKEPQSANQMIRSRPTQSIELLIDVFFDSRMALNRIQSP